MPSAGARLNARGNDGANRTPKKDPVASYYLIPILLVVMSLALTALLYWGGFAEERRNGRARN